MALFRRPGGEGSAEPGKSGGGSGAVPAPAFSPDKARKFFEHAAANHETTNYEYAMTLWLDGLRLDPASLAGLEGFFKSTAELLGTKEGAKGPRKETIKQYSGARSELDRFLYALLQWGIHPGDAGSGVRATSSAAALGLHATTRWLGERALAKAMADRRPRKEWFTALME
ncbi:MAG TPA: hypothetical protein VD963_06135, partial [Phycisphaerales bacterium]|nr:hypothetical protein [Phycisphaerales bacterium]